MKLKCILVVSLSLCGNIFAHDQPVHFAITLNAAESALDNAPDFAGFLNAVSTDLPLSGPKSGTNSLAWGSWWEDNQDQDEGGKRSLNHFYDPLDNAYYKGLSDSPPDRRIMVGTNSFAWGSVSNGMGYNFPGVTWFDFGKNVNKSNIWSWQNARGYEWLGLTATNQSVRQANLLSMFRAVGQVTHLLEDTSQPQHVRNEQHLDKILGFNTTWRSPIEDWGNANVDKLNYGDGLMLDWRGAGFTKLEDFWDRHKYNGSSSSALVADNNENPNGGPNTLGLAEWCNGNFLGARHLYPEYYQPGDIRRYPYPSRNTSTDYIQKSAHIALGMQALTLRNGQQGQAIYLNKTGDGVAFPDISRFDYFGAKFPRFGMMTINDDNVLSNYHNVFIPKAVKYSAGLLDYYFRGTISASVCGTNLTIRNTSGQDFSGGSFILMKDDSSCSNRITVDQFALSGTLPSLGATNVGESDLGTADPTTKYTLVYQGNIGVDSSGNPLDPVDAGIAIATTTFTPISNANCCDGGVPTISGFNWEAADTEIFEIAYPSPNAQFVASGTGCSFSRMGIYATTTYLTNPGDCDVTLHLSCHFVWGVGDEPEFWAGSLAGGGHFDLGYPTWYHDDYSGGTDNPQYDYIILKAHSVTPVALVFLANGGFSGYISISY